MQLSSNFYELHCYVSNFIHNNQFLGNFEMSQSLPVLMNMFISPLIFFVYLLSLSAFVSFFDAFYFPSQLCSTFFLCLSSIKFPLLFALSSFCIYVFYYFYYYYSFFCILYTFLSLLFYILFFFLLSLITLF